MLNNFCVASYKMDLAKKRRDSAILSKKDKKLKKLISKSDSDSDESEHELSHYLNDRVKLMKEVLKIIKPKKIKTMAPECMKKLDIQEINSMLLEELLGISNKRLKYIFNGQNLEEDSSSTDPEAEHEPIDVISLDDISDDDFVIDLDSENEGKQKRHKKHKIKIKEEGKRKKVKKEKHDKNDKSSKKYIDPEKDKMNEENLMSVLELLELQARARAIRSQLALENSKKTQEQEKNKSIVEESDNDDTIIIESPKNIEIIITSSESENEGDQKGGRSEANTSTRRDETNSNGKDTAAGNENNTRIDTENNDDKSTEKDEKVKEDTNEAQVEKKCSNTKSKIMNIESVIISPAKDSITSGANEKDKDLETKDKISINNSNPSTHQAVEIQNTAADESDGIIINMEQYEIDCIISD